MPHSAFQPFKGKASLPPLDGERLPLHQYYVPNLKAKSKSQAHSHNMEFLSKVFSSEGASRFFITFLQRFLFDSGNQSSEDYSTTALAA
ncbi:hypothetical protein [Vampirovibrio sp.]|uniref:hypothetical protein n=1 Tax=Vampirovibrio sp. TaxID=2717857 RepID=UPI003593D922